ncbi:MAG: ABC transporter [Burkholderiaceae bacterium]|uniref:ABC transporter n=1 Tax=Cupriavidus metallidurans TaxID=119219 RepID=A0A482IMN1_9BURK|nr:MULTISPECIES: ABC-type transport auxiliary lipoprotein family protein [Cupriavidus]KWR80543.1 ABC transporter [Cupriavidus sp. SHE]PCH53838.1 MAG: ABC transporter [Burkholderiaceae bacterium]QBP08294.1 ABC transporter [Cupriavidus metallidurans]QWC88695.1 membrane integrity-associated transporter subunit PqiC [Cupriavidus metallidurans]
MTIASALRFTALGLLIALSGCSVLSSQPPSTAYDFGPLAAAPSQPPAPLPKLRITQTDGPVWMDGSGIYYRLQYTQAQRLQAYSTQRWVDSPQHLFNDRLRDAVAARGPLSWSGDTTIPALKVDLLAFEQVFDSPTSSRGVVRARATVYHKGLIGQKTFVAEQPAPSADGQGGVKALSAGVDAVIAAILDWTATLPLDGTQASTAPPAPQRR